MRSTAATSMILVISMMGASAAMPAGAADVVCSGHQLLPKPRPELSCTNLVPIIHVSPDGALHAAVLAVDVSLYATPDMESRVVIRTAKGDTLTSKSYASPRGTNGYYVVNAKWSPDSQFLVFSLTSSGGHSPWSFPLMVYGRKRNMIATFSDMIGGKPTLSPDFKFTGASTVAATTWKGPATAGSTSGPEPMSIQVDLDEAFAKLPASAN